MSQPAPPSPKKPPHKKRHTKPCRYFQVGSCPHTAQEDCNFAHVFSDPPVSLPPPKQCRYYLQGNCTNGIWCQYLHGDASAGSDDHSLLKDYQNINSLAGRPFDVGPNTVQMRVGVVPSVAYVPSQFNGMPVARTSWPYPLEFVPSPHLLPPNTIIPPAASPDSFGSATPSSSPTSSVSDDGVLPVDDAPGQHYSYFSADGNSYVYDDPFLPYSPPRSLPLSVVPAAYGMTPLYEIFSPKTPPSAGFYTVAPSGFPPQNPHPPRTALDRERQRLANYRTKPCRYFTAGAVCPNGDACTFIHGDPDKIHKPPSPPPEPAAKFQHELPSRPLSVKEENTRKGYFPISWRVIGGGVLLSGTKAELSSSDESDLSEDSESFDGRDDPMFESRGVLEIEIPSSAPPHTVVFPSSSESNVDMQDDSTTPTVPARQRASSIPSTPITTHVDHLRLFSAESPGGL
ncbi:hypothetical protein B0H19DRAFT_418206 [Mycena capillaripes]|nr:hypothetical protein B0H19DRAFT_418206 [Mycena capillaripes]